MQSRRDRIYNQYPEPTLGYELNPEHGEFSIIVPEATVNLGINTSFENNNYTGYTAIGAVGSMATATDWQAFGTYSLKVEPQALIESGWYWEGFTASAGAVYTASIYVKLEPGRIYYIWFATTAGALVGTKRAWIGTGRDQRIWVTSSAFTAATHRVCVTRAAGYTNVTPGSYFWSDGLQVENKDHPTTYCDGDQFGFVIGDTPYLWNGIPHASTSSRSADTRSGGREMKLLDLGLRLLSFVGLGLMPLVDQSLPIPGFGELAQGTGTQAREFVLIGDIEYDNARHGSALLSDLYDVVKPDATVKEQPLILRYQQQDEDGDPCGEAVDIICKYRTGLEGLNDNNHSSRLAITFKQYIPYIQSVTDEGKSLNFNASVANANRIIKRGYDGVWADLAGGLNGNVYAMVQMPDGSYIIGGDFTNAGGVANADYIAKWDGTAFTALGTGMTGAVRALAVNASGVLYAGGEFINAGGVANTNHIAKWDGSVWSALAALNDNVQAIIIRHDGSVVIAGDFTDASGVANADYIALWNGAAFEALGTGLSDLGYSLVLAPDGITFYVGGAFFLAGGVAGTKGIAYWNGTTYESVGGGSSGALDIAVMALLFMPNGDLIAGGYFDLMGGVAGTVRIASWNGVTWKPLGSGLISTTGVAYTMALDHQNNLIVGGSFTSASGIVLPDKMALWNGSTWLPVDVDFPGSVFIYSLLVDRFGNLFIGFDTSGTATSSATTIINPGGTSKTFPVFDFEGPGTWYQIKSYTTKRAIYLNLTLIAGEKAKLILDPKHISFVSSTRGDIYSQSILPGSNVNFELTPNDNNISVFALNTSAATHFVANWKPQYNSLSSAVYK